MGAKFGGELSFGGNSNWERGVKRCVPKQRRLIRLTKLEVGETGALTHGGIAGVISLAAPR